MRQGKIVAALAACLAAAACNASHIDNAVAFDPAEAAYIRQEGRTTISGHAFVINNNGYTVNAAGQPVYLVPVTAYSRQRMQAIYGGRKSVPAASVSRFESDPRYLDYTRQTKADSGGKFSFDKVAPGEYYVVSRHVWRKTDSIFPEGAEMYETVKITGKEKDDVEVIVSGSISGV